MFVHKLLSLQKSADLCTNAKQLDWTISELKAKTKDQLIDLLTTCTQEADELKARIVILEKKLAAHKIPTTSRNSSMPPSTDLFSHRNQSLREKSTLKTGGQPGHKGHTLAKNPHPDFRVKHLPAEHCPFCKKSFQSSDFRLIEERQVVDIPKIKASVTNHQVYGAICDCGHCHTGAFPGYVNAPVQYGPNLSSLVGYLSARQYLPMARLVELIYSITNIRMSQGTVANMLARVTKSVVPIYKGIQQSISEAAVVGSDETSVKVKGQKDWMWVWQSQSASFISYEQSRGYASIIKNFPNGFKNSTLVSDALSAQLKTPAQKHQPCVAHMLRELKYFIDKHNSQWAMAMKKLFLWAIELKKEMSPSDYLKSAPRDELLKLFDHLLELNPEEVDKLEAFHKRMKKLKFDVFNFLFDADVPPENNASERAIRNVKVKQKVSGQFRSTQGATRFAVIRSVIDTVIKRGGDPLTTLRFAVGTAAEKRSFLENKPELKSLF